MIQINFNQCLLPKILISTHTFAFVTVLHMHDWTEIEWISGECCHLTFYENAISHEPEQTQKAHILFTMSWHDILA